jgi:hypothetical protein
MFISDCLDICDPVFTFDELIGGLDLDKYLKNVPEHKIGRIGYNPVRILKTVLFGFMDEGYISLRNLEANANKYTWVWKKATENQDIVFSKKSLSVEITGTAIQRPIAMRHLCGSRQTIWAMTSFFPHIISNWA